jgi:peptidoglycan/LPS O-acetylase OafA/YrhL
MFGGRLPYPLLHNGALAPLHGILIVGLASGAGPVGRLLAYGGMRALGDASLPLYLLHIPLLTYVAGWVEGHGAGSMSMMAFVLAGYMAGLIALSLAASRWIVEPGALYIRRRLTPPKGSAPVPAVPAPSPQTSPLVAEGAAA